MLIKILIALCLMCQVALAGVDFIGDADMISISASASLEMVGNNTTISCWIYPNESAVDYIYNKGTTIIAWYLTATNQIRLAAMGGGNLDANSANNSITLNVWQHVLLTWDGSATGANVHIYVDGSEVSYSGRDNSSGLASDVGTVANIGNRSTGDRHYNGGITEFAQWNAILTLEEIALLSSSMIKRIPLQIQPSNLQMYLPLDDLSEGTPIDGETFKDLSGNGNDGTGVDADDDSTAVSDTGLSYSP